MKHRTIKTCVGREVQLHDFWHSTADRSKWPATWLSRCMLTERAAGMHFVGRVNLRANPDVVALVRLTLTPSVVEIAWRRRKTAEWVCSAGGRVLTGENCAVHYNINWVCSAGGMVLTRENCAVHYNIIWVCSAGGMVLTRENCAVHYNINLICAPPDPNICSYYYYYYYSITQWRNREEWRLVSGRRRLLLKNQKDRRTDRPTDRHRQTWMDGWIDRSIDR